MKVLAIETSCDDTCVAVVQAKNGRFPEFNILSNLVSSQIEIHKPWGGVYPTLAKREHQKNLVPVLWQALNKANLLKKSNPTQKSAHSSRTEKLKQILEKEKILFENLKKFLKMYQAPKIEAISVTVGPGLEPCLWVGINFARALSCYWNLPLIAVNHIEAHILANFISENSKFEIRNSKFPMVCLVVSGGHTQLILMKDFGQYQILGETRDDAAGECFDKVAKILGLGYPGGPVISKLARNLTAKNLISIRLPRPMIDQKNYDFSFSGLKTAVLYHWRNLPKKTRTKKYIQALCAEVQQVVVDVLIHKTTQAAKEFGAKTVLLGGGVSANDLLRQNFRLKTKNLKLNFLVPPKNLCTDNAAMVGAAAYYLQEAPIPWQKIIAKPNLRL